MAICALTAYADEDPGVTVPLDGEFEATFHRADINLLNWQHWPYSRYASHNASEFVRMARIPADRDAPPLLERRGDPYQLSELNVTFDDGIERSLRQALADSQMKGFAVMDNGALVFEAYAQGMTEDDPQLLQSSSKTFVGVLIHMLVADGLLDLDAEVSEYLPNLNAGVYDGATVQDLLNMQVGFPDFGSYHDAEDLGFLSEVHMGLKPKVLGVERQSTVEFIRRFQESEFPAGSDFSYNDANTQVLVILAEAVTGERLNKLLRERIWSPMAARYDAMVAVDEDGLAGGSWGLAVTLRDAARFAELLLRRGRLHDQTIVPESYFSAAINEDATDIGVFENGEVVEVYRDHAWYLRSHEVLTAQGSFGQLIAADYRHDVAIVFMGNWAENFRGSDFKKAFAIMQAVAKAVDSGR
jgi:CubicO group peptidase (beta-lactamase class C family)